MIYRILRSRVLRHRKAVTGFCLLAAVLILTIMGPLLGANDPDTMGKAPVLKGPAHGHWMGTDALGRDMLSRVVSGGRTSLGISVVVTALAIAIGLPIGLTTGYFGGLTDSLVMRLADFVFAFPVLLIALTVGAILGSGPHTIVLSLIIAYSPQVTRLVRSAVLATRELDFVRAAEALGSGDRHILFRHVFPNCLAPILVQGSLILGFALLAEASISYLGLGVQPPTSSWGLLLSEGRDVLVQAPYLSLFPGIAIMVAVLGVNLLGDGLRDLLDPRMKK